jgi:hypothetical protein
LQITPITRTQADKSEKMAAPAGIAGLSKGKQVDRGRRDTRRTNRHAYLVVDGQNQGFHCALREYSDAGALLTVSGLMGIPDQFSLYVEPDSIKFECAVSQRRGSSVRVSFTSRTDKIRYREISARR